MKILHINQSDIAGGASIAGFRLHQGLLSKGIDSRLLVGTSKTQSDRVAVIPRKYKTEDYLAYISTPLGLNYTHIISSFAIPKLDFYQTADVLNLHNLHYNFFNYLAISKLTQTKPAIFTLHDMWSFTGHCAYSYDCERWQIGCGHCPYPNSYPAIQRDSTALEWKLKDWVYAQSNLTIVAPSMWLTRQAERSVLGRFPVHFIPNGVDTTLYQPLDTNHCRTVLGLPKNKLVLMFSAANLGDKRKGGDLLVKSLQVLPESVKRQILLLVLGDGGERLAESLDMETMCLGYASGDRLKAIAYSAADLFLFPTRADNLPLVLQEAMACGTPMVSFKVGGVPDLVRPGETGYLAAAEDTADFAAGIMELLEDTAQREAMAQRCRAIAVKEYSLELQAQRYIELYQKVLKPH